MTSLEKLLQQKKSAIAARWFDFVLETYPADTAKFFRGQKDRFANPVGHAISQGIESLFNELLQGVDPEKVTPFLDNVIRIRAIQEFSPSQAVAFVFALKGVVREVLGRDIRAGQLTEELSVFDSRVDELAMLSFDIYMECRERLFKVRLNEFKNATSKLLQKANLICNLPDPDSGGDKVPDNAT